LLRIIGGFFVLWRMEAVGQFKIEQTRGCIEA
jgi:hypothetical protein